MKQKTENDHLYDTISALEQKQSEELFQLKEQFHVTYQSLKPLNLLKNAYQEITETPDLKGNIANNLIGFSSGFLAKKVFIGSTLNPIKNVIGIFLQLAVANVVSKHSDGIKTIGMRLLSRLFNFKKKVKKQKYLE